MEKDIIVLQQYIRRNNVKICGIPNSVPDKDLEKKVIEIASTLNVRLSPGDIEACHRLKDRKKKDGEPKRTIVRFVNRKACDDLHSSKKKLKENNVRNKLKKMGLDQGKIYVNNNLRPYNKFLWGKCKLLLSKNLIDRFWVFNGHLFIADDLKDKRGTKILHLKTLEDKFPGFDFNSR